MMESINEMKTAIERNFGRLDEMENRITLLEDSSFKTESTVNSIQKTLQQQNLNILQLWDNMKCPNLWIKDIGKGTEAQTKGIHNLFIEIISESRAWWRMLVIPAFGRLRPEDRGSRIASAT